MLLPKKNYSQEHLQNTFHRNQNLFLKKSIISKNPKTVPANVIMVPQSFKIKALCKYLPFIFEENHK